MTRTKKLLWTAVAAIAVLDCAVYVGRAAKALPQLRSRLH